jgi:hypothetical protein
VAADGDVVGTWQDKSGNTFHMAAAANDTTRPTYKVVGGKSFVRFDGVNDFLKRAAALGLYAAGSATVGFAVNANPAVDRTLFGVGSSGSNNPAYNFMSNNGTANRAAMRIENDTGVTVLPESSTMGRGRLSARTWAGSIAAPRPIPRGRRSSKPQGSQARWPTHRTSPTRGATRRVAGQ